MTQVNTYQRAPLVGDEAQYHDFVNGVVQACITQSAGAVEPVETYPYMNWLDTSISPPVLRRRNGLNAAWDVVSEPRATQAQAEAGTDNSALMTPLRTAQAIVAQSTPQALEKLGVFSSDGTSDIVVTGMGAAQYLSFLLVLNRLDIASDNGALEAGLSSNGTGFTTGGAVTLNTQNIGSNSSEYGVSGHIWITANNTQGLPMVRYDIAYEASNSGAVYDSGGFSHDNDNSLWAFILRANAFSATTFAGGDVTLYGLRA